MPEAILIPTLSLLAVLLVLLVALDLLRHSLLAGIRQSPSLPWLWVLVLLIIWVVFLWPQ